MRLLGTRLSHFGKAALLVAAVSALAGPAAAAMVITEISLSGHGHVWWSDGPYAPAVGAPDKISISFFIKGPPYINYNASGTVISFEGSALHSSSIGNDIGNIEFTVSDTYTHSESVNGAFYPFIGYHSMCWQDCDGAVILDHGIFKSASINFDDHTDFGFFTASLISDGSGVYGGFCGPEACDTHDQFYKAVWNVDKVVITTEYIPEPATWVLTLTGFGLIGASLRRARRRAVLAA